jgi:uncharacterized repeat protein (TIGR01451 family)
MPIVRRVLFAFFFLLVPTVMLAQSADQEVVSVVDSPDPILPGSTLTYTVTLRNNGPDPAVNGGLNGALSNGISAYTLSAPAGFTCNKLGNLFTCNTPSFAVSTVVITVSATVDPSLLVQPDGDITSTFGPSGTTADPNNGNNQKNSTTHYQSPDADMQVTASDSPDPVAPNGTVTYSINVTNAGPNTADVPRLNIPYNGGTFDFQSITVPMGWSCMPAPTVGTPPNTSCTAATLGGGVTGPVTLVVKADPAHIGLNPATIMQVFGVNSQTRDPNHANDSVTISTQYQPAVADMSVTASGMPASVQAGNNVTFSGNIINLGPDAATNGKLIVLLDSRFLYQSMTAPAGFMCTTPSVGATGTITCTNASFAVSSVPFSIVAKVDPALLSGPGGMIDQAFVSVSDVSDPQHANDNAHVFTTYTTPHADLVITDSDAPDPVTSGGTITYTQTVTNQGPDAATNVVVSQLVPSGTTFLSMLAPGYSCTVPAIGGTGAITCSAATLGNGAGGTLILAVLVTATSGIIQDTVAVSSDTYDPAPGTNSATASTTVQSANAELSITKSTISTTATPGAAVAYTIAVTNNGPNPAATAVMNDALPATLLFQSIAAPAGFTCATPAPGTTGTINCTAATLASGATATFTLNVTIANSSSGAVSNTATASSATPDSNAGNNSATASLTAPPAPSADLSISKSTAATSVPAGGTLNYTISVTNNGPSAATSVVMTDVLPASLRYASITPGAGFTCMTPAVGSSGTITCTAATMASGVTATFALSTTVSPTATGSISNSASIASATTDPTPGNSSSSPAGTPVTAAGEDVPTLSQWALILVAIALAGCAVVRLR